MNLFKIDNSLSELIEKTFTLDCVNMETGEIDFEKATELFETLSMDREVKFNNYGKYIKNLQSEIAALKEQESIFAERRKSKEKRVETLKKAIVNSMKAFGDSKFESAEIVMSLRKSEAVEIVDASMLPDIYMRTKITKEPDKKLIATDIKSGIDVDGCRLVVNQNLQLK